jgi:cell division protein DivIC
MNARRLIIPIYVVLMAVLALAAGSWFLEARAEYDQLKQTELANRRTLAEARARLQEQERILQRLRNDPTFVDKVIRKRLGYARPDEIIFRFED